MQRAREERENLVAADPPRHSFMAPPFEVNTALRYFEMAAPLPFVCHSLLDTLDFGGHDSCTSNCRVKAKRGMRIPRPAMNLCLEPLIPG